MRENPKTQDSTCGLPGFSFFTKKSSMILWSIRTFWYKGSAENQKKNTCSRKTYISQKQQPKTKSVIFAEKHKY